jgi:radical SAM protein with 4Fe4S-binding SPASM domain
MIKVEPNATYKEIRVSDHSTNWERKKSPAYWEYRRKWEEYPKKQIVNDFPIHLDIETTNACNLKCAMCPRTVLINKNHFYKIQFMDFDFFRGLIDQGVDQGLCSVKLSYLGEPLLHPDVVKQVKYAKDRDVIDVMFNTNGTLLTETLSQQLLDAGLDKIFFSFDSHIKEEYEKIRVGANFEKTVENIKAFVRIKNRNGYSHVETRVSMVLSRDEEEKFRRLTEMWRGIVDTIGFGYYVERDHDKEREYAPVEGFVCAQPWQRMFVMADGIVTACCADERREYVLGDAIQERLADIWKGRGAQALREAHECGHYDQIAICRKCYVPISEEEESRAGHS